MRIRSLAVAVALLAFGMPTTASAYETMTTNAVNVRAGAGTNSVRITTLPPGAFVWVDFCRRGWCAIKAPGLKGWVSARYLGSTGGAFVYRPPSVYVPAPAPRYVPPLVIPRGHYHDYGHGDQHKFQRPFE